MAKIDTQMLAKRIKIFWEEFRNRKHHTNLQITDNDTLNKRGVYFGNYSGKLIDNQNLSVPLTINNAFNRHVVFNVLNITNYGNIIISGFRYNPKTDNIAAYSETIFVYGTGFVQTKCNFIGEVTIIGSGFVGNIDAYISEYLNFKKSDFDITSIDFSFVPDKTGYSLQLTIYKIHKSGQTEIIYLKNFTNSDVYAFGGQHELGSWKFCRNFHFEGSKNEGFYVVVSGKDDISSNPSGIRSISLNINILQDNE